MTLFITRPPLLQVRWRPCGGRLIGGTTYYQREEATDLEGLADVTQSPEAWGGLQGWPWVRVTEVMCVPLVLCHSSERGCVRDGSVRSCGNGCNFGRKKERNWDVDSCFGGEIGGPFVSCQEKSVTNYLCLSPKRQLWKLFAWVCREDA